jgi:hypothetical protein
MSSANDPQEIIVPTAIRLRASQKATDLERLTPTWRQSWRCDTRVFRQMIMITTDTIMIMMLANRYAAASARAHLLSVKLDDFALASPSNSQEKWAESVDTISTLSCHSPFNGFDSSSSDRAASTLASALHHEQWPWVADLDASVSAHSPWPALIHATETYKACDKGDKPLR